MSSVVGIFNPQITILYAEEKYDEMVQMIKSANRIMIFMLSIPIAFVTAFGDIFFSLWLPAYDAHQLHLLCVLSMGTLYVSMSIQVLYHIFIITKKVKVNSLVVLLSGFLSTGTVFLLLKTTNLGLYAIVLSSAFYGWLRNLLFTPLYASKCLQVKWTTFYGDILTGVKSLVCVGLVGLLFRTVFPIHSWITLIGFGCVAGVVALIVNYLIVLKKEERAHGGRLCEKEAAPVAGGISHGYGACGESGIHAAKRIVLENQIWRTAFSGAGAVLWPGLCVAAGKRGPRVPGPGDGVPGWADHPGGAGENCHRRQVFFQYELQSDGHGRHHHRGSLPVRQQPGHCGS